MNWRHRLTAAAKHFSPVVANTFVFSLIFLGNSGLRLLFIHVKFERKFAHLRQLLLFLKQLIYFVLPLLN